MRIIFVLALITVACLFAVAEEQKEPIQVSPIVRDQVDNLDRIEIENPEIKGSLTNTTAEVQSAIQDAGDVVGRKGTQRRKEHFWCITEQVVVENLTIMRRVHFESENGPMIYASKRVFEGEGEGRKELKDRSYVLYFYPDGRIKSYLSRGSPQKELHFYPSGKVKQYDLVKDEQAIVSVGWQEDGKTKYEKYKKPNR